MNRDADSLRLSRRALLQRAGLAGAVLAGVQLTGCSDTSSSQPTASAPTTSGSSSPTTTSASGGEAAGTRPASSTASAGGGGASVLLAYFSRAGENYFNGGRTFLDVGNTQVVAELIQAAIPVDVYRIEAADPYPDSYDETVARNVREQDDDARPVIANPVPAVDGYDTVLLGSGIWNVRPPMMMMSTFLDGVDLTGKRLAPFVTYAVSGLGRTSDVYTALEPGATITDGLAVRGEEAADAGGDVDAWLRRLGLLAA